MGPTNRSATAVVRSGRHASPNVMLKAEPQEAGQRLNGYSSIIKAAGSYREPSKAVIATRNSYIHTPVESIQ